MDQLSHLYTTAGKTIAFNTQTFISKVVSLLFDMLSRLVTDFLPRSKCSFHFMAAVTDCYQLMIQSYLIIKQMTGRN